MGNILILYDSRTGHTQRMAEYVARGAEKIPQSKVKSRSADEATPDDLRWCDGIAVGSPTQFGVLSAKMKRFWEEVAGGVWGQMDGKIGCAFSSSGGLGGGAELTNLSTLLILMNYGFLVFGVPDYVGEAFTLHYGAVATREPSEGNEIAACERLGERLAQWVAAFAAGRASMDLGPVSQR